MAAADFYPRISLGGSAGLIGGGFDAILTPLISWSFINQGAIRAKVAAARGSQAALASWDAAILRALREVETVLADYQAEHRRHAALALALRESEAASSRALVRYQLGADSFLVALDAERTRNEAALMLSSSNLRIGQIQISLFRALGGGWENGPAIATAN
ncbi:MAG: TolC family protein [Sphingomonadales bacterium]|nr:TolC family protein [Sphingomonadales bacterium]